jgi:4-hydroxy-2-oxoglutarate aldolase
MMKTIEGVIPPVTTPFSEDGSLLIDSLERNVSGYVGAGMAGLLLLGSNGEAVHLSEAEKEKIVEVTSRLIPENKEFLVGLSFPTLRGSLGFIERVSRFRVDGFLVSVPSYYRNRMTSVALGEYFTELADRASAPLLLYNVPQYSGLELSPDLVSDLAGHPNIVGMKDSSANLTYLQRVLHLTGSRDFQLLLGSAQVFGPSLTLGIRAAILAVACAFPRLPLEVLDRYRTGQSVESEQMALCRVGIALTTRFGVAGLKHAMDLAGWEGRHCRRPILDLDEGEGEEIENLMNELEESVGFSLFNSAQAVVK